MMYAEASYAGTPMFGPRNPNPTYFQHIADRAEHLRLEWIQRACRAHLRGKPRFSGLSLEQADRVWRAEAEAALVMEKVA
jgi:hypothetical protein